MKEELNGKSLRDLAKLGAGDHNPIFSDLLQHFKQSFLIMSPTDEATLAQHIQSFKLIKSKYTVASWMMQMMTLEQDQWKFAFASFEWSRYNLPESQQTSDIDNMMKTLMQVFVLKMCTTAYREVVINNNP